MVRKSSHPDKQLFAFLNGALDEPSSRAVEDHLASCQECDRVAALARALKAETRTAEQASARAHEISGPHPDVSELASFFYGESPRARRASTAAHVVACSSCARELAAYAQAEHAASIYDSLEAEPGKVPGAAWEMIRDWEESGFAKPRPASDAQGMLMKLSRLLTERAEQLRQAAQNEMLRERIFAADSDLVPVIIIDRSGEFHGVELFERATDSRGNSILKHPQKSERFNDKPFHAFLDFGEERLVVSDKIRKGAIELRHADKAGAKLRRADYFIIED